jgi:CRP-like cAMP-binding protein
MAEPPTQEETAFLASAAVFSRLPEDVLRKLLDRGRVTRYADGEVIFRPGDPSEEAYVVKSGVVEVCRPDAETGMLVPVAYIGAGDVICEMLLFTGSTHGSLGRVPERAELFAISRAGLIELCREEPDLALFFCRLFASRLESWLRKGRYQDSQSHLQGHLKYFDLATVLQTLGGTARSGTLTVRTEAGDVRAELEFDSGRVRRARLGHLRGEQAFFQLFQPPPVGQFVFRTAATLQGDAGPVVDRDVVGLLMEAMRLQDEWEQLRERFRDPSRVYTPAVEDLEWDDDATMVAAFDVWAHLHRATSVEQLVAGLPYSAAVTLRILDALVETGQVA